MGKIKPKAKAEDIQEVHAEVDNSILDPAKIISLEITDKIKPTLSVEDQTKVEVAKFDIARSWIAGKKAEYSSLSINGLEDKEGHDKVKKAWQEVSTKRLLVEKRHAEIKEPYLRISQALDSEKRELTELLKEIEDPLKTMLNSYKLQQEEMKLQKKREEELKLQGRVNEILQNGMSFNGSYYAIGDNITIDVVTLKELPDSVYDELLSRIKAEGDKIKQAEAERLMIEEQERNRQEQIRVENEKEAKRLQEAQAEIERERAESRHEFLVNLGYAPDYGGTGYIYQKGTFKTVIPNVELGKIPADKWAIDKDIYRGNVGDINNKHKEYWENIESEKQLNMRISALSQEGAYAANNRVFYTDVITGDAVVICTLNELGIMTDLKFTETVSFVSISIKDGKKKLADIQAIKEKIAVRKKELEMLGFTLNPISESYERISLYDESLYHTIRVNDIDNYVEEDWEGVIKRANSFVKEVVSFDQVAAEKERQENLSEIDRAVEWVNRIFSLLESKPVINNKGLRPSINLSIEELKKILLSLMTKIEKHKK